MTWQDGVLTAGGLVLLLGNIILLRAANKPPAGVSLIYSGVLFGFGTVYITLSAPFAAAVAFLQSLAWLILAGQVRHEHQ